MKTSELDYQLPDEQIAQHSASPRDASKLFVFDRVSGEIRHHIFRDITQFLKRGDLLVFNNSKVFRARVFGHTETGGEVEVFLLRPRENGWECLGKPGKRLPVGGAIIFSGSMRGEVVERFENGRFIMKFVARGRVLTTAQVISFANKYGEIPIPPYVGEKPLKFSQYQTVYAKNTGSVAAPTAGFHFTKRLLAELQRLGIKTAEVTLHVGIGTFQPIKTDVIEEHEMHYEWVEISKSTARAIEGAHKHGSRVIAVGTTTVRALEGRGGEAGSGDVNLFMTPGKKFKVIDALITNFHLPRSTLMLLVSAFIQQKAGGAGVETLKKLYEEAIRRQYRFYSFGDAMFIQ